jgi:ATP-dependent Clp protease ATP-binding subunit ClpC
MKEIEQNPDVIVFIDEIHTIIGAGSTPGSMDAANIMKPALARGTMQCIGATTLDEYRNSVEKDGALERRFQKVQVEPTTQEETLQILRNIKDRYEHHHHVTYTDEALMACVKLTDRYVTDRFMPDKAIDALDETGSRVHLSNAQIPPEILELEKEIAHVKERKNAAVKSQDFELAAGYRDRQTQLETNLKELNIKWQSGENEECQVVDAEQVANVVSMMTGVPVQRMAEQEGIRLKGMQKVGKYWYYFSPGSGAMAKKKWKTITTEDGLVYKTYFKKNGRRASGWLKIKKKWYLFDKATGMIVS